jgi:ATP adenylyltransferase
MAAGRRPLISKDIWPQERDFLERPDRYKYVRKIIKPDGCVFCNTLKQERNFQSLLLWSSNHTMVVMNKYPYNTGHLLVLPVRHTGDLADLSDTEYKELSQVVRLSVAIVRHVYTCSGLNIGMNHGHVAGAGIPDHLHWHIVPRWQGDTNFFTVIAETKVLPESVEQSYYKIKPMFDNFKI